MYLFQKLFLLKFVNLLTIILVFSVLINNKIKYIFFKLKYICIFDTYIISTYDNLLYPRVG